MLAAALEAEVDGYISSLIHEVDDQGHRLVVRNGHAVTRIARHRGGTRSRSGLPGWTTGGWTRRPGRGCGSGSSILPPWARKSPKVAEVLPLMYLHGMSSGDFVPAAGGVLRVGCRAVGLGDHPADYGMAEGTGPVRPSFPEGRRLRLRVRRRDPLQRPPRGGPPVCPGHRGCPQLTAPRSWSRSPTATGSRPSRWADVLRDLQAAGA